MRYWRDEHAPKAAKFMKKYNVQFYSQTYTPKADSDAVAQALFTGNVEILGYNGIATIVFNSSADAEGFWKDPEHMAIMKEDGAYLTQGGRFCIAGGQETVILSN